MLHRSLKRKRHVGWRSLALGIGIGVGLSEIVRRFVGSFGLPVPWWQEAGHVSESSLADRSAWSPPLETPTANVSVPTNVAPFRSPQVDVETPLPELPRDIGSEAPVHATTESLERTDPTAIEHTEPIRPVRRRASTAGTTRSSTPEEIKEMDSESVHNEQAREEVPSDPDLPKDIRTAIGGDGDMHRIAIETLRRNPHASLDDVMSAWHAYRGVTIDAEEAARVASVYGRLNETYEVA